MRSQRTLAQRKQKRAKIEKLLSVAGWTKIGEPRAEEGNDSYYQMYEKKGTRANVYLGDWYIEADWHALACDYQNSIESWVLAYIDFKYLGPVDTIMDEEFERMLDRRARQQRRTRREEAEKKPKNSC